MLRSPVLALTLGVLALPAIAATPESGAITDTQSSVEFSGGPYVFPNATNLVQNAGQETICEEGTETCDIFRFEVNLTTANVDDDQIVVTVGWNDSIPDDPTGSAPALPDYDLELYNDTTGEFITQQATADNPEIMMVVPNNGKYQLRIIPYAPMAEPYTGKVQFVKFEEEKNLAQTFFAGAFDAGALLLLAGLGVLARRKPAIR